MPPHAKFLSKQKHHLSVVFLVNLEEWRSWVVMILVFLKLQEMKRRASQAETRRDWCNTNPPTHTCDPQQCSAHFQWVLILISKSVNLSPGHPVCPTTSPNHSFFLPTESAISFPISEDTLEPSFTFFHVFPDHFLTELPSVKGVCWLLGASSWCPDILWSDSYKSSLSCSVSFKNGSDFEIVKITLGSP